jgi:hypothetical protein
VRATVFPEILQRLARALGAADREAICKHDRVHRACASATDPFDLDLLVFQQTIQNAPGKSAM